MLSLACNLTKTEVEFLPIEISSKKVCANNADFLIKEITSKIARGNNVDFLTIEITSKKELGNDMNSLISKITSKKYVEMTWKSSKFGLRRIAIISRHWFDVACPLGYVSTMILWTSKGFKVFSRNNLFEEDMVIFKTYWCHLLFR